MSSVCIDYKDIVQIIKPIADGYGSEKIGEVESIPALYIQNTGWNRGPNRMDVTSDAEMYVDPTNSFVMENWNRLDGMLVIANPFSSPASDAWYRIVNVSIGQDKLLSNTIDNIRVQLKKTTEIPYVS